MTAIDILKHVDHTLLKADATLAQVEKLCSEAAQCKTASVCVNPAYVKQAAEYLKGEVAVCTVIGFPLGANKTEVKVCETKQAIFDGADEVDMVINIGALKSGNWKLVEDDIKAVRNASEGKILKVIVETFLLNKEEKERICEIVRLSGADYIKTSTGFAGGGATLEDAELFIANAGGSIKVKASGGIRTREEMEKYLKLGVERLGTSAAVEILKNEI